VPVEPLVHDIPVEANLKEEEPGLFIELNAPFVEKSSTYCPK
jgi:hypothetical protein